MTYQDWLRDVCRETAKLAYPGHMNPLICKGGKVVLGAYFEKTFCKELFKLRKINSHKEYKNWHQKFVKHIVKLLQSKKKLNDSCTEFGVGAKLLDTFMFSLMKHKICQNVWKYLYLPLDYNASKSLQQKKWKRAEIAKILEAREQKSIYTISAKNYYKIQELLWEIIKSINRDFDEKFKLTSRVELNCVLWA